MKRSSATKVWAFWLAICAGTLGAANNASATTLDFESAGGTPADCSASGYNFPRVAQGYGGFTFSLDGGGLVTTWVLECNADYMSTLGNGYGATSGEWAVGNDLNFTGRNGAQPLSLTSASPFFFTGAQFSRFTGLDPALESTSITIEGYLSGALQYTVSAPLTAGGGYGFLGGPATKVDELRFLASDLNTLWLMDDFSFRAAPADAPVPEPTTMLLLGTGIAGAVARRRRRRS